MHVTVKVRAGAGKEKTTELTPLRFEISVREQAERNQANRRVIELLAARFGVPVKQVRMIKGHRSPSKVFAIPALDISAQQGSQSPDRGYNDGLTQ